MILQRGEAAELDLVYRTTVAQGWPERVLPEGRKAGK